MSETIDKKSLHNEMLKLVPSDSTPAQQFPRHLEYKLQDYLELIQGTTLIDGGEKDELLSHIKDINKYLIESVKLTYSGQPAKAYESISHVAERIKANTRQIAKNQSFYRMRRVEDSKEKRTMNHIGMFHIPFSLRSIVTTQRYSMPGYPCLYLGETSFACWEELGRPNLDSCMVSRVENHEPFTVWDLRIPDLNDWKDNTQMLNCLRRFPLVIACTFKTHDDKAVFKPEYIIPQLLLELLQGNPHIDGIEYTSIHWEQNQKKDSVNQKLGLDKNDYSNIVIPVQDVTSGTEHCPKLCDLFHISDPTCEEYERIQPTFVTRGKSSNSGKYKKSLFGRLEQKLKESDCFKITENPLQVCHKMIEAKKVYTMTFEGSILDAIHEMRKNDYTHTPIVEQSHVAGVFSENTVFKSLCIELEGPIGEELKFKDIERHVCIQKTSPIYMFVKPEDLMSDVRDRFEREHKKNDRKDLILVTTTGDSSGEFRGLLTSYDLIGLEKNPNK